MLILGGSATVSDLTGMNTVAACFLIPLGVSIYVLTGGMRATLIADYSHTLVLYCILIAFALTAYGTSDIIGSPGKMWDLLSQASLEKPISGNAGGSYLTMRSKSGLIFGVLNIVGELGYPT
jgi:Na+/proline symporter